MIPSGNLIGFQATLHFPDCFKVTCGHTCRLKWYTTWGLQVKFYLGKMRTAARKTAPQMALRNCSKEIVGEDQYIRSRWKRSSVQSSAYFTKGFLLVMRHWYHHEGSWCFSRYEEMQGLGTWNQFRKISNYLKTCSTNFPGTQSAPLSMLNYSQGVLKVSSFSTTKFNLCRGRWQMPLLLLFSHWQMLLARVNL